MPIDAVIAQNRCRPSNGKFAKLDTAAIIEGNNIVDEAASDAGVNSSEILNNHFDLIWALPGSPGDYSLAG
jgi:hypothetical protein